jgi:hypothetical protein
VIWNFKNKEFGVPLIGCGLGKMCREKFIEVIELFKDKTNFIVVEKQEKK